MVDVEDFNMIESSESKLNAIINALNTLAIRTVEIEGNFANFLRATRVGVVWITLQPPLASEVVSFRSQRENLVTPQYKEPRVSLPKKFDGTRSKFRGFVSQVQLVTFLQPERYSTKESRVELAGTLLIGEVLS